MVALIDLTGERFGRLVVIERAENYRGMAQWSCRCDCGSQSVVRSGSLRSGRTTSCGCFQREVAPLNAPVAHGHARGNGSPEYASWRSARGRATNHSSRDWPKYGGRGITMCQEWLDSFEAFLSDVGPKPGPEYSLDRIDNDGPYAPWNCRWATPSQQAHNRRPRKAA